MAFESMYPIGSTGFSCHLQPSEAKATGDVSINTGAPLVCCRWACWAMVNGGMRAWHGMAAMVSASLENSSVLLLEGEKYILQLATADLARPMLAIGIFTTL